MKKPSRLVGQVWPVEVTALDAEGDGVALAQDRRIAIPNTVPGDAVDVRITWASATTPWTRGTALGFARESPLRQPVDCAHAPTCVGCAWAPMPQSFQLEHKRTRLTAALAERGLSLVVPPLHPAPQLWGWRTRSKYVVATGPTGAFLGAYAPGTHDVEPSSACAAVHPLINQAAQALQGAWGQGPPPEVRYVLLRTNGTHTLGLLVVTQGNLPPVEQLAARWRDAVPSLVGVLEQQNNKATNALLSQNQVRLLGGEPTLDVDFSGVRVALGPLAFQQVHAQAAQALMEHVRTTLLGLGHHALLVDAYCGAGAFAWALRNTASRVVGVESSADAVEAAQLAAQRAGLTHVSFVEADAATWLAQCPTPADAVVVDPPREGLGPQALAALTTRPPRVLVYVSCDPQSLARDLVGLLGAGMRVHALECFDLFPHTSEVETVVTLVRA